MTYQQHGKNGIVSCLECDRTSTYTNVLASPIIVNAFLRWWFNCSHHENRVIVGIKSINVYDPFWGFYEEDRVFVRLSEEEENEEEVEDDEIYTRLKNYGPLALPSLPSRVKLVNFKDQKLVTRENYAWVLKCFHCCGNLQKLAIHQPYENVDLIYVLQDKHIKIFADMYMCTHQ